MVEFILLMIYTLGNERKIFSHLKGYIKSLDKIYYILMIKIFMIQQ